MTSMAPGGGGQGGGGGGGEGVTRGIFQLRIKWPSRTWRH